MHTAIQFEGVIALSLKTPELSTILTFTALLVVAGLVGYRVATRRRRRVK